MRYAVFCVMVYTLGDIVWFYCINYFTQCTRNSPNSQTAELLMEYY
jgi:hypothetical protein